jgi:N6-adenosine-specific RNA methylase IME4
MLRAGCHMPDAACYAVCFSTVCVFTVLSVYSAECLQCWVFTVLCVSSFHKCMLHARCCMLYCGFQHCVCVYSAECLQCWVFTVLSVYSAECLQCWVFPMLSVSSTVCVFTVLCISTWCVFKHPDPSRLDMSGAWCLVISLFWPSTEGCQLLQVSGCNKVFTGQCLQQVFTGQCSQCVHQRCLQGSQLCC